jgi:hypothetical protein
MCGFSWPRSIEVLMIDPQRGSGEESRESNRRLTSASIAAWSFAGIKSHVRLNFGK